MWKTAKLGDVAKLYQPKTITKKEMSDDGEYPVYGANGIIGRYNCYNHEDSQLVIGCRGSCGEVNVTQEKCWITGNAMVIQPKEVIAKGYLRYFLLQRHITNAVISGTAQPQITRKSLSPVEIAFPPLAEQQRIVAKLDAAFAEIDRSIEHTKEKQKAIEDLTSIAKKNFLEFEMSGAMTLLGESCEFFNGKAHEKDIDDEGKYVVVNSKFISSDGAVKKYTNEQMFPLSQGDIVMVMSDVPNGKALAKTYLIEEGDKYSLNQRICCIRSPNYDAKYLKTIIDRNPHFLKRDNGENQTNLRKADILGCPLPVTTEETQKEREKYLSSLTADLKSILLLKQRIIDEYTKLKSAILAQELQPPQSKAA